MSHPKPPLPVKAFAGILLSDPKPMDEVVERLIEGHGEIDMVSEIFPFTHTDYYEREMGKDLIRRFVTFRDLMEPDRLPILKHLAFSIERRFSDGKGRKVNIDPGYIALEKVVLSTFKNFSHRLYLGDSVYGDLVLIYRKGSFLPLEWTFPDYREDEIRNFLESVRRRYIFQLKGS